MPKKLDKYDRAYTLVTTIAQNTKGWQHDPGKVARRLWADSRHSTAMADALIRLGIQAFTESLKPGRNS